MTTIHCNLIVSSIMLLEKNVIELKTPYMTVSYIAMLCYLIIFSVNIPYWMGSLRYWTVRRIILHSIDFATIALVPPKDAGRLHSSSLKRLFLFSYRMACSSLPVSLILLLATRE